MTHRSQHAYEDVRGSPKGASRSQLLKKFSTPKREAETSSFSTLLSKEKKLVKELIKLRQKIKKRCPHIRARQVLFTWQSRHIDSTVYDEEKWIQQSHFEVKCEACHKTIKEGDS